MTVRPFVRMLLLVLRNNWRLSWYGVVEHINGIGYRKFTVKIRTINIRKIVY